MFKTFFKGLSDLLYPPNCLICQKFTPLADRKHLLCPACQGLIQYNLPPFCVKCSRHLEDFKWGSRCQDCAQHEPAFDFAWSACLYNDVLKTLIHRFKYSQKTFLSRIFAQFMVSFIKTYRLDVEQFDNVLPIPLSSARQRERGFNQARLLAEHVAREFNIGLSSHNLIKVRHTQNQALLSQKERWTNIKAAFKIKNPKEFEDKNILLVDDLLTTGATASEAARCLKEAKAKTVGVFTLAVAL